MPPPTGGQALAAGAAAGAAEGFGQLLGAAGGDELRNDPILASVSHGDLPGLIIHAHAQAKEDPAGLKMVDRMDQATAGYDPTGLLHGSIENYKGAVVFSQQSYDEHPDGHMIPGINLWG
jgi:hypothetical protein